MIEVDDTSTRKEIEKEIEILKKCKTNHVVRTFKAYISILKISNCANICVGQLLWFCSLRRQTLGKDSQKKKPVLKI